MWKHRKCRYIWLLALLLVWQPPGAGAVAQEVTGSLAGQLLVARPGMRDTRFRKSVVLLIEHGRQGALGLIVNKKFGPGPLADLMKGFGLDASRAKGTIDLYYGGPVGQPKAFVLHSGDYAAPDSRKVAGGVFFSTEVGILSAIAAGEGPRRFLFATGYAVWQPGQLEWEIEKGAWKIIPATEELVFGDGPVNAWDRVTGAGGLPI